MDDDENIDWDAFTILSADPEIDVATAYAASIRDEPPKVPFQESRRRAAAVIALLIAIAMVLLLLVL